MSLNNSLRTIETATSSEFIKTLLEEKIEAFGFAHDDQILSIEMDLPDTIPLKIKFKKEKEAKVIIHNGGE